MSRAEGKKQGALSHAHTPQLPAMRIPIVGNEDRLRAAGRRAADLPTRHRVSGICSSRGSTALRRRDGCLVLLCSPGHTRQCRVSAADSAMVPRDLAVQFVPHPMGPRTLSLWALQEQSLCNRYSLCPHITYTTSVVGKVWRKKRPGSYCPPLPPRFVD